MRPLTLDDIADLRAYERERDQLRQRIIDLKRVRRVAVGPVVTLVFENRDTMRFQVQEMARAERILSDEAIQHEIDTYNALIPGPGQLSATLFLELTSKMELYEWLPKLVGIERAVALDIGGSLVPAVPEEGHAEQLTRPDATASVHYIRFELSAGEMARFASEPVAVVVDHPQYVERVDLLPETRKSLLSDLHEE